MKPIRIRLFNILRANFWHYFYRIKDFWSDAGNLGIADTYLKTETQTPRDISYSFTTDAERVPL